MFVVLFSPIGFGQQFFESDEPEYREGGETNTSVFQPASGYQEPDQGLDGPGNGGDPRAPIDNWLFLLPLAAIGIGCYFLK